jgi:hypothetical protein
MGNYHLSRAAPSASCPATTASQIFFPAPSNAIREREDAACYESMGYIQQECIDNSDDESVKPDETTVLTAPKKNRAKTQPILEYTDEHGNHDTATHQHEFAQAGCHGAIGSTDAVHATLEKVQKTTRNSHLGCKLSHTARTYNVTMNHRRRILSTTEGHPAS